MRNDEKKEMKWIYEIIVGSIPPFSLLVQIKIEKMVYWKGPHFKSVKLG